MSVQGHACVTFLNNGFQADVLCAPRSLAKKAFYALQQMGNVTIDVARHCGGDNHVSYQTPNDVGLCDVDFKGLLDKGFNSTMAKVTSTFKPPVEFTGGQVAMMVVTGGTLLVVGIGACVRYRHKIADLFRRCCCKGYAEV